MTLASAGGMKAAATPMPVIVIPSAMPRCRLNVSLMILLYAIGPDAAPANATSTCSRK